MRRMRKNRRRGDGRSLARDVRRRITSPLAAMKTLEPATDVMLAVDTQKSINSSPKSPTGRKADMTDTHSIPIKPGYRVYCGSATTWTLRCVVCGQHFHASLPQARYCNDQCQRVAYLARRKARRQPAREQTCAPCQRP